MNIVLLGAADTKFHFSQIAKLSDTDLKNHISGVAQALVDAKAELVLFPDKGISFLVAQKFKELGGKKVFAALPAQGTERHAAHLAPYANAVVGGKRLFDEIIDAPHAITAGGEIVLVLGISVDSFAELLAGYSHERQVSKTPAPHHKGAPRECILYMPFCQEKLSSSVEAYFKKSGVRVHYATSIFDLKEILFSVPKK